MLRILLLRLYFILYSSLRKYYFFYIYLSVNSTLLVAAIFLYFDFGKLLSLNILFYFFFKLEVFTKLKLVYFIYTEFQTMHKQNNKINFFCLNSNPKIGIKY